MLKSGETGSLQAPAQSATELVIPQWPCFSAAEAEAAGAIIASGKVNYWTGEHGRRFESEFAKWSGSAFAVALSNGTAALELALQALEIGPGDEVIVTPRSFIASVSAVINAGATPIFADVDRDSGNLTAETIAPLLTERSRAIVVVHLAGWPCPMPEIMALARARDIAVIEDCAQAHGAKIGGRSVGTFGAVGTWSFCQDKIISTAGEGGMVTTGSEALWRSMWSLKDHGKDLQALERARSNMGFSYVHGGFGHNWRMPEVQAAIGRMQLHELPGWHDQRTRNALRIADCLAQFDDFLRVPLPDPQVTHAFYRLYAYVRPESLAQHWSRDRIIAELRAVGVPVMHGTCPEIYLETAFDHTGFRPSRRLAVARELGETGMAFQVHPTITDAQAEQIAETITRVLKRAAHGH